MEKYRIVPKRDFGPGPGFYRNGKFIKSGFVVTGGKDHPDRMQRGCNVMPGATWFYTPAQAMQAIKFLEQSAGDSKKFWQLVRTRLTRE